MPRHLLPALLVMTTAAVGGCATLDEGECRTADWREIGRTDGAHGYPSTRVGEHAEACHGYGVQPDLAAYRAGREEGLRQYCRPETALTAGRNGDTYQDVCPGPSGALFNRYYARGATLRALDADVHELQSWLDGERRAQDATKDLTTYKALEQNVRYLERQLANRQRQLDRAEAEVAADRDPPPLRERDWKRELPYPDAHDWDAQKKKS